MKSFIAVALGSVLTLSLLAAARLSPSGSTSSTAGPISVNDVMFVGEVNRLVGIGGEVMLNRVLSGDDPATPGFDPDGQIADPDGSGPIPAHRIERIDVGDRLVGIGVTQVVECLSCPAGTQAPHQLGFQDVNAKAAARAFAVVSKQAVAGGYRFTFGPLSPAEYSATVLEASKGAVSIPPASIPPGTMVVSYDDPTPNFTLNQVAGSPGTNWIETTDGARLWNVGVRDNSNFWMSTFPSDDVGMLPLMPPENALGTIRFGLSLLSGNLPAGSKLGTVPCNGPNGPVQVEFCLSGSAVGTQGTGSAFPIGLATEVRMHLVPSS